MMIIRALLFTTLLVAQFHGSVSQFCESLNNSTWSGFLQAVIDSSEYGLAVLCPFEISGDGCPSEQEYPDGFKLDMGSVLFVSCDPFLYGYNINSECIIDCPGRHFTISGFSSLTLERMILSGATDSSIKVEAEGSLSVINSILKDNIADSGNGNGGAIYASRDADITVEYSQLLRNQGLYGGAIFGTQETTVQVVESIFEGNRAMIAGGAYANEANANSRFENTKFRYNEASSGGAIFNLEYSSSKIFGNEFEGNQAINGGAIFNGGTADIFDSVFNDNLAEDAGGALYIDGGASTVLKRNRLVNNNAGVFGPAVSNRFNTLIEADANTACGNSISSQNSQCNGVFVSVDRRRVRCMPFANECEAPTSQPSKSAPSVIPTSQPSPMPSLRPTIKASASPSKIDSNQPTVFESSKPTSMLSESPSKANSEHPSFEDSFRPTGKSSGSPTRSPSEQPSIRGSIQPTRTMSRSPSTMVSGEPSSGDSSTPSSRPSISPSKLISERPSISSSSNPTVVYSATPSNAMSGQPTLDDSSEPTRLPTNSPSLVLSEQPSYKASSMPTIPLSSSPTRASSGRPSMEESSIPTIVYSTSPSAKPSVGPSFKPSYNPTVSLSVRVTLGPSPSPTVPIPLAWSTNFPLKLCEGDCDSDRDCDPGLVCFQRGSRDAVPGCFGGEDNTSNTDYCIRENRPPPPAPRPTPLPTDQPTLEPSSSPSQHVSNIPSVTPTHDASAAPSGSDSIVTTSKPSSSPSRRPVYVTNSPTISSLQDSSRPSLLPSFSPPSTNPSAEVIPPISWSTNFPLKLCEGDCDSDRDCDPGLVCFQRGSRDAVPGCFGGEDNTSNTDFCIRENRPPPPTPRPTPLPTDQPTLEPSSSPSQHVSNIPSVTPTHDASAAPSGSDSIVTTSKPSSSPSREPVSMTNSPTISSVQDSSNPSAEVIPPISWSTNFPLKLCEGDCDSDNDCVPGLVCFQRGRREKVPGCSGGEENTSKTDYCIKPSHAEYLN